MDDEKTPTPRRDEDIERAPGGADADLAESDVGAANRENPVVPDQPLSAQQEGADVPDEIQEPEETEEPSSDDSREDEVEPSD